MTVFLETKTSGGWGATDFSGWRAINASCSDAALAKRQPACDPWQSPGHKVLCWILAALSALVTVQSAFPFQQTSSKLAERLLEISQVSDFRWSPAGDKIAYLSNESGTSQLHLLSLIDDQAVQLTAQPHPVVDPQWSPDGARILFLTDPGWQERYEVWEYDLNSARSTRLLSDSGAIKRNVRWSPDASRVVLETNQAGHFDLVTWSRQDPVLRPLVDAPGDQVHPAWSPDGRWVAFVSGGAVWRVPSAGGSPDKLVQSGLGSRIQAPGWSPDGKHLLFLTDLMGYWDIAVYTLATGHWQFAVTDRFEKSQPAWSSDGTKIAFISTQGFDKKLGILDHGSGRIEYAARSGACFRPQWSPSENKLAFIRSTSRSARDLWLVSGDSSSQLTDSMGGWKEADFSEPESHTFVNREGLPVPALLYKPQGFREGKRYPAILRVHGSFSGQWIHDFDLLGQYFLRQGMMLFYPNPRGSGGYGRAYERLNDGDWGGGDVDDLLRAHDYLSQLREVDPNRIAAWGGSYGGYLTYSLVSQAPDRFGAAIVRAGISDLRSHIFEREGSPGRFNSSTSGYPRELGGFPDENVDFYRQRSPLTWVDRVKTPMLIMHGLRDDRVPPSQSQIWAAGLSRNGVVVELQEYPTEDHSLTRFKKTVVDRIRRMENFFERVGFLDSKPEK